MKWTGEQRNNIRKERKDGASARQPIKTSRFNLFISVSILTAHWRQAMYRLPRTSGTNAPTRTHKHCHLVILRGTAACLCNVMLLIRKKEMNCNEPDVRHLE